MRFFEEALKILQVGNAVATRTHVPFALAISCDVRYWIDRSVGRYCRSVGRCCICLNTHHESFWVEQGQKIRKIWSLNGIVVYRARFWAIAWSDGSGGDSRKQGNTTKQKLSLVVLLRELSNWISGLQPEVEHAQSCAFIRNRTNPDNLKFCIRYHSDFYKNSAHFSF